ncbi:MAG: arginine--tRNA ligase [Clostridiales bacterium]|nr:arginine--tRNA ligase [Clostridiales bacterium]
MMNIRQQLTQIVSDAFEKAGYSREYGNVTGSNRPDLCQFQCNGAMSAAKEYKKAPIAIARDVAELLKADSRFSMVDAAAPGFINMSLDEGYLAGLLNDMAADSRLLLPEMQPLTIVIDYGAPNVAKPLHVGHLRSTIIGDALYKLAKFLGHRVISDVHLGDWGLQMGLVIAETRRQKPGLVYFDPDFTGEYPEEPPLTVDEMNFIYPQASARAKEDEAFAAEAAAATVALQNKARGYYEFWQQIRQVSVDDLKRSYDILGVSFDYWYGESDAAPYIEDVLKLLREKGLLQESEGALIVDVSMPEDKEPMPPMIIVKSDGGDLYGTTDLGTLLQRMRDWNPDEIWYVVDNRQSFHFKQVFRCAGLAGIIGDDTLCIHIGFGTMNGKDGKPYKTREGGVMRLSDLIETVTSGAYDRICQSDVIGEEEEKRKAARMVGMAALKIGDLINHRNKDYIFDLDRFLATDGKTGPYLQYTAVRINSVLSKAREQSLKPGKILPPATDTERDLMLSLIGVADNMLRAFADKAPNVICESLFDIATVFNKFYGETKILTCADESRRASWLGLLELTHRMLIILLDIIGVDVPEKM